MALNLNLSEPDLIVELNDFECEVRNSVEKRAEIQVQLWNQLNELFDSYFANFGENISIISGIVKIWRTLVAQVPNNQNNAVAQKVHVKLEKAIIELLKLENEQSPNEEEIKCLRFSIQALSNMVTGNSETQKIVWSDLISREEDFDLLGGVLKCKDTSAVTVVLVLIFNCIHGVGSRSSEEFVTSAVGIALIRSMLQLAESTLDNEESKTFELVYGIVTRLIEQGHYSILFERLAEASGTISFDQSILLKILDARLSSDEQAEELIDDSTISHMIKSFIKVAGFAVDVLKKTELTVSDYGVGEMSIAYSAIVLFLQTFSKLTHNPNIELANKCTREGLLAAVISLLGEAERVFPRIAKATTTPPEFTTDNDTNKGAEGFAYIKRDIIRLIGNLSYENKFVQDETRDLGGLALVLSNCNIDDRNPYIREYAIFAVRSLLQNNPENQKLVEEMKPINAVQHPVLEEVGVRTELENGKIKLNYTGPAPK
ncbi:Ataxin-10 [Basidiobolus ranarum]|uniref:Ataxin-10 homolog n=1 Tax=Basidiobolus ranarum TaxID=34480 RepID=A0ABR2WB31_9FUNG